jgi:hypothetical protein
MTPNRFDTLILSLGLMALVVPACAGDPKLDDMSTSTSVGDSETGEGDDTSGDSDSDTSPPDMSEDCGDNMCPDGFCPQSDFVPDDYPCCDHGGECGPDVTPTCDIWNPDDCPEGEKCTAYATAGSSWDANKCVMIMGDGQPGDDCVATDGSGVSGNDDCAEGSMCWDINQDTQTGYCVEFCTGSAENSSCNGDTICAIYNDGVLPLCLPTCDPLSAGGDCPNDMNVCVSDPGGDGFVCVLNASGQMAPYGTECQYVNSCNQGLFCAAADAVPGCAGSQGCCSEFCDINEPNTCSGAAGGQECVLWFEEGTAPPGYENIGGCAIPG